MANSGYGFGGDFFDAILGNVSGTLGDMASQWLPSSSSNLFGTSLPGDPFSGDSFSMASLAPDSQPMDVPLPGGGGSLSPSSNPFDDPVNAILHNINQEKVQGQAVGQNAYGQSGDGQLAVPPTGPLVDYARQVAQTYKLDPDLFVRQIQQESGFNPNARSKAGAMGIAQFMPGTAAQYGVNTSDPYSSLDGAARHMRDLLTTFHGDYRKALAAYNAGAGAVLRAGGVPANPETQQYVRAIYGW